MRTLLLLLCLSTGGLCRNFIDDPKCPPARPQTSCAGRRSNCWSPGVRDTDCPGHGLCCYDGCANTCVSYSKPSASQQAPVSYNPPPPPPPPTHRPAPPPPAYKPPPPPPVNNYIPPPPSKPTPAPAYIPPPPPTQSYVPPPAPTHPPTRPTHPPTRPPRTQAPSFHHEIQQPSIQQPVVRPPPSRGGCPAVSPLPVASCGGRYSTCWSVGVSDLDCPNWGLCCFDGCANTCLDSNPRTPAHAPLPKYEPPRNPCDPNPCGPGSMCIPQEGEPECKCPEGLVPNPTPQQGCIVRNPCDPNPCGPGSMCIPNEGAPTCKCPEGLVPDPTPEIACKARDPCDPSPCGPGTTCTPNRDGNPICRCLAGLIPKPDTITGCGPECVVDPDCEYGYVCQNQQCVEKPDPCNPSPCGPGTTCTPNRDGNPICKCLPGLIPKPDTITGCGPECTVDPDCNSGYICSDQQRCVERPDPCDPNPCGEGALCIVQGDSFTCECPVGTVGNGNTGCFRGECIVDDDCSLATACQDYNCVDPCLSGTCRSTDFCRVMQHQPICGFNYDPPPQEPKDPFVIGERFVPAKRPEVNKQVVIGATHQSQQRQPEARNPVVVGGAESQRSVANCRGGAGCTGIQAMMMMMDTSRLPVIGASFNRKKRQLLKRRRKSLKKL